MSSVGFWFLVFSGDCCKAGLLGGGSCDCRPGGKGSFGSKKS